MVLKIKHESILFDQEKPIGICNHDLTGVVARNPDTKELSHSSRFSSWTSAWSNLNKISRPKARLSFHWFWKLLKVWSLSNNESANVAIVVSIQNTRAITLKISTWKTNPNSTVPPQNRVKIPLFHESKNSEKSKGQNCKDICSPLLGKTYCPH